MSTKKPSPLWIEVHNEGKTGCVDDKPFRPVYASVGWRVLKYVPYDAKAAAVVRAARRYAAAVRKHGSLADPKRCWKEGGRAVVNAVAALKKGGR